MKAIYRNPPYKSPFIVKLEEEFLRACLEQVSSEQMLVDIFDEARGGYRDPCSEWSKIHDIARYNACSRLRATSEHNKAWFILDNVRR